MIISLILPFYFLYLTSCLIENPKLESVIIIVRHGDQSPNNKFSQHLFLNTSFWPEGWNELTKKGKQKIFELGRYFRLRYADFLTYSPKEVYLQSSIDDKCMESAAVFAAGAYPAKDEKWKFLDQLDWMPILIHTTPKEEDGLLNSDALSCPRILQEEGLIEQSSIYQELTNEHQDLMKNISQLFGIKIITLINASDIYDTISIAQDYYPLPSWITKDVFNQLKKINTLKFSIYYPKIIQKLISGLLVNTVRKNLFEFINQLKLANDSANNSTDTGQAMNKKIFIYVTHGTQLTAFLYLVGSFNYLPPPFGASVIIELYSAANRSQYFLKFYYLNQSESKSSHLLTPLCCEAARCDIYAFFDCVETIQDWKHECSMQTLQTESWLHFSGLCLIATLIVVVIALFLYRKFSRRNAVA